VNEQRFAPLTDDTMTPDQKRVVGNIWSTPRDGSLGLGPFNSLLRSPELADRVQRVGEYLRFQSSLHARLTELAILVTARKWTAQFEWWAHLPLALKAGLDPRIAEAISRGERPATMDAEETLVYEFSSELLATGRVTDERYAGVREAFGERGAIDLVGTLGYYGLISMVLNVDRCPIPRGGEAPLK